MFRVVKLLTLLAFVLAGCAIGDPGEATPAPPVTLMPPPEMVFQGNCNNTRDLELWLQITTRLANEFLSVLNIASTQGKGEMRDALESMASIRDSVHSAAAPDCAVDAQIVLSDAMNTAVGAVQAYVNGDRPDLGSTVVDVTEQVEQVIVVQSELTLRMETQIRQALATVTPG